MKCPSEFTFAMFVDGELDEAESRQVRIHLDECRFCRELGAALHEENRVLSGILQAEDPEAVFQPADTRRALARLGLWILSAAFFGQIAMDAATGVTLPPALEWINPFSLAGQLNFLLSSLVYLLSEGGALFMSIINSLTLAALVI